MITTSFAEGALRDIYLDAVKNVIAEKMSPFYQTIDHNTSFLSGVNACVPIITSTNGKVVAVSEDDDLPSPTSNNYVKITLPLKNIYGQIEITDKAIRSSSESGNEVINLLESEMQGLVKSAKENFSRMLFSDGKGYLATITQSLGDGVYKVNMVSPLYDNMSVEIGNENYTILAVNVLEKTIELDDEYDIVGQDIFNPDANGLELTGLKAIFEKGLYGQSTSYFRGRTINGSLSEDLLSLALDDIDEIYGEQANIILCSYQTRRKIAELIKDQKRVVNTVDAQMGYGEIAVCGVPVVADRFCPDDRIYILNTNDFKLVELCDWDWLITDDGKILHQICNKAAFSATLVKYAELICLRPEAQTCIVLE